MDHDLLIKALNAAQKGQKYAFATVVETTNKGTPRKPGAKMVVLEDGSLFGTIGGGRNEKEAQKECLKAILRGKPALVTYDLFGKKNQSACGGQMKVFIEPFVAKKHLIICGAGHISLPLSVIAKILNYKVTIVDDRKSFANKKRFPHVDTIVVGNHTQKLAKIPIDPNTQIMIMTQDHEYDFDCVKAVVQSNLGYLGVISSRPKRAKLFEQLKKMRVSDKFIKRIHIPAGIDIGGQTPEEIAVSIAAELVAENNRSLIGSEKFKKKP
ncbi:MAG: XdhC family protein [Candidatus Omnitrophica bacterium]|nr:XdhC family protein [Candidatus Omnitrophota bacterium]